MSNGALRIGDTLVGSAGEHGGHYDEWGNPLHPSVTINGEVSNGSSSVFINGKAASRKDDSTMEYDECTNGSGIISTGSSTVFINGKPAARQKDQLIPHAGTANFTSSSSNVIIGD